MALRPGAADFMDVPNRRPNRLAGFIGCPNKCTPNKRKRAEKEDGAPGFNVDVTWKVCRAYNTCFAGQQRSFGMGSLPSVIFLMGPTASGKTQTALEMVERFSCEIVSVDSSQVYRGMDIGSAKPPRAVLERVPHRLVDIRDPAEAYSAAEFCRDALEEMARISGEGRIPLLTGGTMLYFRALQRGLSHLPSADLEVRRRILEQAERQGWASLHERVRRVDPATAARIHPNDRQRIQRALEVYEISGKSWTQLCLEPRPAALPYRAVKVVIAPAERRILHERIEARFDRMLGDGLVEEVSRLYRRGDLSADLPAMRAVGYRQVWNYLAGNSSYQQMRDHAVAATRQFAKRQLTWLRAEPEARWFDAASRDSTGRILGHLESIIS